MPIDTNWTNPQSLLREVAWARGSKHTFCPTGLWRGYWVMEAGQDAATTPSFILASFTPGNSGVLSQVTNLDQERSQTENAISVVLEYGFSTVDIWGQSVLCDGGRSWALRGVGQHPRSPPTRCQEMPRRPQVSQPQMSHRCQNHPRVRTTTLERHPWQRQRVIVKADGAEMSTSP